MRRINCFEPYIGVDEVASIVDTVASGKIGYGVKVEQFEKRLTQLTGCWSLAYSSASAAAVAVFTRLYELHGPCLVVTPSLTFTSPVKAAEKAGHEIMWVDVDQDCVWSALDYKLLRGVLDTDKQIVCMPMLYGGVTGKDRDFGFLGDEIVVVDSAHCLTPKLEYDYAFLSFHPQKPLAMAQGGALLVHKNNWDQLMWFMRFKDFGRESDGHTYKIVQDGFKYYMDNLNASLGLAQIEHVFNHVKKRKENLVKLASEFDYERLGRFTVHDNDSSFYLGTLVLNPEFNNAKLIQHLGQKGIQATFHYPALHNPQIELPITEIMQTQLINLPIHQNLDELDIQRIAEALGEFDA